MMMRACRHLSPGEPLAAICAWSKVIRWYSRNCNNAYGYNAYFRKCIGFRTVHRTVGVVGNRNCIMHNASEFSGTAPAIDAFSASANASLICRFIGKLAACAVVLRKRAYVLFRHHKYPCLWTSILQKKLVMGFLCSDWFRREMMDAAIKLEDRALSVRLFWGILWTKIPLLWIGLGIWAPPSCLIPPHSSSLYLTLFHSTTSWCQSEMGWKGVKMGEVEWNGMNQGETMIMQEGLSWME